MISVKEFRSRRRKFCEKLDDGSVVLLYAGVARKRSADENYPFFANRNFFYLTNIEQEGSVLLITKSDGIVTEYLFISEYDEIKEKWTGVRLTTEEAIKLSGIDNVLYLNAFMPQLGLILDKSKHVFGNFSKIYMDLESENKVGDCITTHEVKDQLSANYDYISFEDAYPIICNLRSAKSVQEVEEEKGAIVKTNVAINRLLKALKPGLFEYQLSSLFYYTIQDYDFSELAFSTICASGVNATILHYPTPVKKIKDGDLVLFDLGAKNNGYNADISRTFPANGKFTEQQKLIYNIVLECNKMIIKTAKPGLTLRDLQQKASDFLARKCYEAGLIKDIDDIRSCYYHSVSHHIGLDTHDPISRDEPLVPGNIISDEPGLYFKELGIGIRIEDDLLITDDGCYCLSGNIIKEVNDIEKAMLVGKNYEV